MVLDDAVAVVVGTGREVVEVFAPAEKGVMSGKSRRTLRLGNGDRSDRRL